MIFQGKINERREYLWSENFVTYRIKINPRRAQALYNFLYEPYRKFYRIGARQN